jgi:6-phosphogluconolactonase (cycloisomerase 2 family)
MINEVCCGMYVCHVDINSRGDRLVAACYGDSCVRLYEVNNDGSLKSYTKDLKIHELKFGKEDTPLGPDSQR